MYENSRILKNAIGALATLFLLPAAAHASKCIIKIDYCLNPSVNVASEIARPAVQSDNVTCMAKAEELKSVCLYRPPVTATFLNNSGVIVHRARFRQATYDFRNLEVLHQERRYPAGVPKIAYGASAYTLYVGTAAVAMTPKNTGGTFTTCRASATLPQGLTLNQINCAIQGRAGRVTPRRSYTITAVNQFGASSTNVTLEVIQTY